VGIAYRPSKEVAGRLVKSHSKKRLLLRLEENQTVYGKFEEGSLRKALC